MRFELNTARLGAAADRRRRNEPAGRAFEHLVDLGPEPLECVTQVIPVPPHPVVRKVDAPERRHGLGPIELHIGMSAFERGVDVILEPGVVETPQELDLLNGATHAVSRAGGSPTCGPGSQELSTVIRGTLRLRCSAAASLSPAMWRQRWRSRHSQRWRSRRSSAGRRHSR